MPQPERATTSRAGARARRLSTASPDAGAAGNGRLFICAQRLDVFILPVSHLSVVFRGDDGLEIEYEGAPERPELGNFGRIVVTSRPYRPRPDRPRVTVPLACGEEVPHARAILEGEVARLNTGAIPYDPFGPNSNTVARTFLVRLGLAPLQPAAVAPGFEHDAL